MYGKNLSTVIALRCVGCGKFVAARVDPEDVQRRRNGMFVQVAFADRAGKPYLTAAERELLISGVCGECWPALCPSNPLAYS